MAAANPDNNAGGSGVLIRTLRAGDGRNFPRKNETAIIHYKLYLAAHHETAAAAAAGSDNNNNNDDILIQDTYARQLPLSVPMGQKLVAPGLEAALERLSVGQIAWVFIPSWHAYGSSGKPPWIPPGSDLLYQIELLRIKPT